MAGDQVFVLGLARDYSGRFEEHSVDTRYDQVFLPRCHEAHMVGRDGNQVMFRKPQRQRARGRPSVAGAQRDSGTKAARLGWVKTRVQTSPSAMLALAYGIDAHTARRRIGRLKTQTSQYFRLRTSSSRSRISSKRCVAWGRYPRRATLEEDVNLTIMRPLYECPVVFPRTMGRTGALRRPKAPQPYRQGWAGCNGRIGVEFLGGKLIGG